MTATGKPRDGAKKLRRIHLTENADGTWDICYGRSYPGFYPDVMFHRPVEKYKNGEAFVELAKEVFPEDAQ